jgi:hypothetical protein
MPLEPRAPDSAGPGANPGALPSDVHRPARWLMIVCGGAVVGLGIAWFLISHFGTHDDITDAITEGVGAALGLLIAMSVVGAVVSARGAGRDRDE